MSGDSDDQYELDDSAENLIEVLAGTSDRDVDEFREEVLDIIERSDDVEDVTEILDERYGTFDGGDADADP